MTEKKKKNNSIADKLAAVDADRELFSRIVVVARTRDISLKDIFAHELSSVPQSIAQVDGTLRKAAKSALLTEIEKEISAQSSLPEIASTTRVIDGMAILQMVGNKDVATFGQLGNKLLHLILKPLHQICFRVDVIFDRYDCANSIKTCERSRCQTEDNIEIHFHGQNTPLPKDWKLFMGSSKNKSVLISFRFLP